MKKKNLIALLVVLVLLAIGIFLIILKNQSPIANFTPEKINIYVNSQTPKVQIDSNHKDFKNISNLIAQTIKYSTKEPMFISLAVTEETIEKYKENNICVELILKGPCNYRIYGEKDSRAINLKKCLIALNNKMLFYADGENYMNGPISLFDNKELLKEIEQYIQKRTNFVR